MKILIPAICVLALTVVFLFRGCGNGFGFGKGSGNSTQNEKMEQITDSTTTQVACIEITVSGANYIHKDKTISIETLPELLQDKDVEIRIFRDDTATYNAVEALEKFLTNQNITYHFGD